MKYLLLPALTITAIAALFTGCGSDITHSHDIYREQFKYKPLPQPDTAAPTPTPAPQALPPSEEGAAM